MKVGIIDLASPHWTAGGVFSDVVRSAVAENLGAANIWWVGGQEGKVGEQRIPIQQAPHLLPPFLRRFERSRSRPGRLPYSGDLYNLDVILPVLYNMNTNDLHPKGKVATVGWIPDFQHVHLPQYFSAAENATRDTAFRRCAELNELVLMSSEVAAGHFGSMFPEHARKARVATFPSTLVRDSLSPIDSTVLTRYGLPSKFILVANQFWPHKNHLTVIRAATELKKLHHDACLVLVGHLGGGSRLNGRCVFSELLQEVSREDLGRIVRLLGEVPRKDLIQLLRHAAAVMQPSEFEGWSTTLQDAKALGRPVICSDIDTHREQAPSALAFFRPRDTSQLAQIVLNVWADLSAGPDTSLESKSLETERRMFSQYGARICEICHEATALHAA